ncbi:MAG: biopolymer transporter ExbD [Sphingomonadaceae bacterium]|nr:biopolymer transporter ExbD [Sphingomonadaceae bacterium]
MATGATPSARRSRRAMPMSEINVTPLVDVMLVLLIIFMVAAPLLVAGVPLDLPGSRAKALPNEDKPIAISIDARGRTFIGEDEVPRDELRPRLDRLAAQSRDKRVLVRADRSVDYGTVLGVLGEVAGAGLTKVSLIARPTNRGGA